MIRYYSYHGGYNDVPTAATERSRRDYAALGERGTLVQICEAAIAMYQRDGDSEVPWLPSVIGPGSFLVRKTPLLESPKLSSRPRRKGAAARPVKTGLALHRNAGRGRAACAGEKASYPQHVVGGIASMDPLGQRRPQGVPSDARDTL